MRFGAKTSGDQKYLSIGTCVVLLIFNPYASYSPISLPKSFALTCLAVVAMSRFRIRKWSENSNKEKYFYIFTILFFIFLFIPMLFSGTDYLRQFYGREQRSYGFLTIASLLVLLISAFQIRNKTSILFFRDTLVICGAFVSAYAYLQTLGIDAVSWNNSMNLPIGTLGNTNYFSAFMGMVNIAIMSSFVENQFHKDLVKKFMLLSYISLNLYLIYESDSVQGFYLTISGLVVYALIWIWSKNAGKFLKLGVVLSMVLISIPIFLGLLNKGVLASVLYQQSTSFRGDFWRAGIKIFQTNWFTGVGLDNYGDYYRNTRSLQSISNQGLDGVSQSAHNMYIDFAANGGILLCLSLVLLVILVFHSIFSLVKNKHEYQKEIAFLAAIWTAFFAQSLISVNQISLSVIGWITAGFIIGLNASSKLKVNVKNLKSAKSRTNGIRSNSMAVKSYAILHLILSVVLVMLSFLPLRSDYLYVKAVQSKNVSSILEASETFPRLENHYVRSAQIFMNNQIFDKAILMAQKALAVSPNSLEAWEVVYEVSPNKSEAKANILRIEPNYIFEAR